MFFVYIVYFVHEKHLYLTYLLFEHLDRFFLQFQMREEFQSLWILMLNLFHVYEIKRYSINEILIISVLLCIIYACSDEIHQLFISGRVGSAHDVLIDSLGIITGTYICKKMLKITN